VPGDCARIAAPILLLILLFLLIHFLILILLLLFVQVVAALRRLTMVILTTIWDWIRSVVGLILPVFSKARDFPWLARVVRWTLHIILLALILVGLWYVNQTAGLKNVLRYLPDWFKPFWLPALFLCLYFLSWLAWILWQLLLPDQESSDFPDIDAAWEQACRSLGRNGITVRDLPLYLMLGRNAAGVDAVFKGSQLTFIVNNVPSESDAPLHVYVDNEGIYVACSDTSLLGQHAAVLAGATDLRRDSYASVENEEDDAFKTAAPGGLLKDIREVLRRAEAEGRGPDQLTEEERRQIRLLQGVDQGDQGAARPEPRRSLLKDAALVDHFTARFQHLCRLIVRDRRPYCPINGMLVLLPLAATDSNEVAEQTASICQKDMLTARATLRMDWPILTLVCDLERLPGFKEMLAGLPGTELRKRRMGQRFPIFVDIEPNKVPERVENLADWVCEGALGNWVFKLFHLETPRKPFEEALRANGQLYRFYSQLRERRNRLGQILSRGIAAPGGQTSWFAGCYLAATGRDTNHEQAFLPGVIRRMVDRNEKPTFQNSVAWNEETLQEERDFLRWARVGYMILGLVVLGGAGLLVWLQFFKGKT